jgi:hypothetical protein
MNFNFGEVLTRAWQIIWKHKILWVFGILASCGQGGGNFNSNSGGSGGNNGADFDLPPQMLEWARWIENNVATFIAIVLAVTCIIVIITAFLSTIGRIGLIRGAAQAEGGVETLVFGQLFSESMPYFWRMFWLGLVLTLPVILVVVIVVFALAAGIGVAATGGDEAAALGVLGILPIMLGCFCLLVPVMFVLGMIFRQAERAIVLEDLGVMPALSRGWEIFRANLGPIILMAIILGVIGFGVGLVFAIPIILIVFPAAFAFALGEAQNFTPLIFAAVCFCLYVPVLWLLQGILVSYTESAWTLTYLRLTNKSDTTGPATLEPVLPSDSDQPLSAPPHA